jgi:hypothetical protein
MFRVRFWFPARTEVVFSKYKANSMPIRQNDGGAWIFLGDAVY